jgi:hypothetical protein
MEDIRTDTRNANGRMGYSSTGIGHRYSCNMHVST